MNTPQNLNRVFLPIPLFLPNILCYSRIILSFLSVYTSSLTVGSVQPFLYVCFTALAWIIASILDHLDGKLARHFNQCSQFGVLLDIIADNILRGSSWMACIVVATSSNSRNEDDGFSTCILCMLAVGFTTMEWMTMFSTQMLAVHKDRSHWKELNSNPANRFQNTPSGSDLDHEEGVPLSRMDLAGDGDRELISNLHAPAPTSPVKNRTSANPWLIERMFQNNFCNLLGAVTIYGSMGCGMIHFLHLQRSVILKKIPWLRPILEMARVAAYIGRLLALYAELWFCFDYFRVVVNKDEEERSI
jgi:phosphatidylglycerophosphate synthase